MELERRAESWRKFFVILSGVTNGAHSALVEKFKSIGQIEVSSVEESDYILLFSPVTSQLGTEFNEALRETEGNKPIMLVVMHHSSNPDHVMTNRSKPITSRKVHMVLDFVFHEGHLLDCKRNNTAWREIETFLQTPASQGTNETDDHAKALRIRNIKRVVAFFVGFAIGLIAVVVATRVL